MIAFGWHDRPAEVEKVLATLPFPTFAEAASNLAGSGEDKTVLLWEAAIKLTGKHFPAQQQPRGTCVSRGFSRCVDYVQAVEIALGNEPEEFKSVSHAVIYGFGMEVGGHTGPKNSDPDNDGLVGAWAAKAINTLGNVSREDLNDPHAGSDRLAIEYAVSGVPAAVREKAKPHLIKTVTLLTNASQARDMLVNGYPVSCCSNRGFSMERDAEGRCRPQGQWNHCMMWSAYDAGKKRFCVEQSWGQNTPSGPLYLNQPDNSFWIDWDVADAMIRQRDTFAVSAFDGFPARTISWVI